MHGPTPIKDDSCVAVPYERCGRADRAGVMAAVDLFCAGRDNFNVVNTVSP